MSEYSEFFLKSKSSIVGLETVEISHPKFSKVYRIVRNNTKGISATIEDGSVVTFSYYPLKIEFDGMKDDLDSGMKITLGDLSEILPVEMDNLNGDFSVKPTIKYRVYRSDDLTTPIYGPIVYGADDISFDGLDSTIDAQAPSLNNNRTGIIYDLSGKFRTLKGFL
ncbi:minor tail protein [Erwinia phage AH03]|uniref:Minor tail protein n=1 Tax=Erwinia phage AH03 TaxID=2869568 RepID=A0AAE7X0P9_9CAUD|nr:minor tail protein [Erwinia phage AH03]